MPLKVVSDGGTELMTAQEVRIPGWTEQRYFNEAPEQRFYEFKDGELIMNPPVSIEHQDITGFLFTLLRAFVSSRGLGRVFCGPAVLKVRENLHREPDIFFASSSRAEQIREQFTEALVELVVEVTSQGAEMRDLEEKRDEYEGISNRS